MKKYPLAVCGDHPEIHFEVRTAARLARVSETFILQCEREELVASRTMLHGQKGLCAADVRKLKLVRHLHEDMGLDLEAVDLVLRYRNRIRALESHLADAEQQWRRKVQKHRAEIRTLQQRLAQLSESS